MASLGMRGPYEGLRVLDFGQYLAGPLAAMLFADQGATWFTLSGQEHPAAMINSMLFFSETSLE